VESAKLEEQILLKNPKDLLSRLYRDTLPPATGGVLKTTKELLTEAPN